MAEKDIYISKIHGAKIRDEELTQRVASLEASTSSSSGALIPTIKITDPSSFESKDGTSKMLSYAAGLGFDISTFDENDYAALNLAYMGSLSGVETGVSPIYMALNADALLTSSTSSESTLNGNNIVTGELKILSKAYDAELSTATTTTLTDDATLAVAKSLFPFPFIVDYGTFSQITVGTNNTNNSVLYRFINPDSTGNAVARITYSGDYQLAGKLTENKLGVRPGVYYLFTCSFSIFGEEDK